MAKKIIDAVFRWLVRYHLYALYLNMLNRIRYGSLSPRYTERVWIIPDDQTLFVPENNPRKIFQASNSRISGKVVNGFWPLTKGHPIYQHVKIKMCIDHWEKGIPWDETGIYERFLKEISEKGVYSRYGFKNKEDIVKRYKALDQIFLQAQKDGRLKTDEELDKRDGIKDCGFVHIGPSNTIFWSGGSQHRLAIAYILQIPIPATIGAVHIKAIPYLDTLRKPRLVTSEPNQAVA